MPCILLVTAIVALVIGIQAFGNGIQVSGRSKERWTGRNAKIVGSILILYGGGIILSCVGYFIYLKYFK